MKNGAKMLGGDEGIRGSSSGGNNNDNKTWMIKWVGYLWWSFSVKS
jgi:hypothetical protein